MFRLIALVLLASFIALAGCQANPQPYIDTGDKALAVGNYNRAAADYEKALEMRPDMAAVRNSLARAYIGQGKYLEGAEMAKGAYAQRPDVPAYADTVAEALLLAGRNDEMFRFLRQNAADRGRVDDWIRLGRYSQRAGDPDSAQTALLTAARIDDGRTPDPQIALFDLYSALGQSDKAMQRLRMAYYIDPQSSLVRNRLTQQNITPGQGFGLKPAVQ